MTDQFCVRVTKDHLVFSAAHFITFGDNTCERLHGHNFRVEAVVEGSLGTHSYVVDFIALRDALHAIVAKLDHRMLLPASHPLIRVEPGDEEVVVRFENRRWVFPQGDCVVLPVDNTTAELLAQWIADQLLVEYPVLSDGVSRLSVSVDENHGQWATCQRCLEA